MITKADEMIYKIAINSTVTGKIPAGSPQWATFNDKFRNLSLPTIDIANAIYTGHAYAGWHNGRRSLDNFICSQHIAIDMDTQDARSTLDALKVHRLVRTYCALIHTTPSHTPQSPRARVVFFLDSPIENAQAYQAAARFLVSQFDGADAACTDASRFFYGSKNCDIEYLDNVLPLAHLRHYYRQWLKLHPQQRQQNNGKIVRLNDYRASRVTEQTPDDLDRVRDALAKIDPWSIDYNRWIGVIAALKRQFGDVAQPIAVAWANGKPGEVEREWDRLRVERGNGMTAGSIFYMARTN